ncbi:ubiquitin-conjugating enzyme/RWD-like protein [Microdochium trichocladiopsis]|uniref:Ubiquitin-conjugating enzyme E2 Z n=1 Tax=Microdochium trichocladiopsis TaxID=1682393 RepID=A0A9P8Y528_9PEZI|nr:ubiquitin-conjugating enzyme/RWD-like protein [Microdochium trichocladiopsis]KAH7029465.1 ubiquitin-conjugating enzyme/RWD-like protein [Microdochium trichocladiopsis]
MTTLAARRIAKERLELEKPNDDYFVHFNDENLLHFDAYVVGPADTPYQHKLALLRFEIPARYPLVPPVVKFIQHTGHRIHPNLYVEGKVCLSILGTWPGEPWAYGMTCHTILVTIRSLLDDKPYKHEPNQNDNPAFNKFVEYSSWRCMLLDYLARAPNQASREFITRHISNHGEAMRAALAAQAIENRRLKEFSSPYLRGRRPDNDQHLRVEYPKLQSELESAIEKANMAVRASSPVKRGLEEDVTPSSSAHGKLHDGVQQKRIKQSDGATDDDVASDGMAGGSTTSAKPVPEVIDLT